MQFNIDEIKNNPYFKKIMETTLIVSYGESEENIKGKTIDFRNGLSKISISLKLLKKLLTDDRYYGYVKKIFNGQLEEFCVCGYVNGDITNTIHLSKTEIVNGIDQIIKENQFIMNEKIKIKFSKMKEIVSYSALKNEYSDKVYKVEVEGKDLEINVSNILLFLELPDEYYDICLKQDNIFGVNKEEFIYTLVRFFLKNDILDNYNIPPFMIERLRELRLSRKIDYEYINKITSTIDQNLGKTEINGELKREILKDIPKDFNTIEKAIYIYIKMCKLLTYDDEFYAVSQKGDRARKHENVYNLKNINLVNNRVVCYEFNALYAILLNELDIKYEIKKETDTNFGGGHEYLNFRYGKFLVQADSTTSILMGDIFQAKLNQNLRGLRCINTSESTDDEFYQIFNKVYSVFKKYGKKETKTFAEMVKEYMNVSEIEEVSFYDKVDILFRKLNEASLTGIDAMSYALQLSKVIDYHGKNIKVSIISNNENERITANAVIIINSSEIGKNNTYFYYIPQTKIVPITKEELEAKFNLGLISYVNEEKHFIPGIGGNNDKQVKESK